MVPGPGRRSLGAVTGTVMIPRYKGAGALRVAAQTTPSFVIHFAKMLSSFVEMVLGWRTCSN